jgi:ATP synthase protein I
MPKVPSKNSPEKQMWRGALLPSLIVTVICVIGSIALKRGPGAWGSLLASLIVLLFFSVHLGISAISKNLDPIATMALAMFSYFAKVMVMGAFLIVITKFTSPSSVNRPAFAITALAITGAWLAGEIRAFLRLRLGLPLPSRSEKA